MNFYQLIGFSMSTVFILSIGCKPKEYPTPARKHRVAKGDFPSNGENYDPEERAEAAKLVTKNGPVGLEIVAFREKTRDAFNNSRFDELEKSAAELRASKGIFGNGTWKIWNFYQSLTCGYDESASTWELHERIHKAWIAAKPESITASTAYADFLVEYAWQARGSGYANSVSPSGWSLMRERLDAAYTLLAESRKLTENDPVWWTVAMHVALGQSWDSESYDKLVAEAVAFEPKFPSYDQLRAYSLLPRWSGEPGDWEAYAEKASKRPGGLGAEGYAGVVVELMGYYDNIFHETKASWPKTREGLMEMRKKYPQSLEVMSRGALLATMAEDRPLANEMFDLLGDNYLPAIWCKPERFTHYRHWARTGEW